jgi:hypothetical protein
MRRGYVDTEPKAAFPTILYSNSAGFVMKKQTNQVVKGFATVPQAKPILRIRRPIGRDVWISRRLIKPI